VGTAPAHERCGKTRDMDGVGAAAAAALAAASAWTAPCGLRWLAETPPGRAGDGRGIPGDPGQAFGAGDAKLDAGNGLSTSKQVSLVAFAGIRMADSNTK